MLKEKRQEKGLTQQQLADLVHCRRETIANIENGKYNTSLDLADYIAQVLDCTLYDIFDLYSKPAYEGALYEKWSDGMGKAFERAYTYAQAFKPSDD